MCYKRLFKNIHTVSEFVFIDYYSIIRNVSSKSIIKIYRKPVYSVGTVWYSITLPKYIF